MENQHYRFGLAGEGQADIIESYLDRRNARVLNVGCGPWGQYPWSHQIDNLARLCRNLIAADICEQPNPNFVAPNVSLIVADAEALPLMSESIDCILALGLFAYFTDPVDVLQEFYRVCKSGGNFLMTNSVAHSKDKYRQDGIAAGFEFVKEAEGYCRAASGNVKRRYLLLFKKPVML